MWGDSWGQSGMRIDDNKLPQMELTFPHSLGRKNGQQLSCDDDHRTHSLKSSEIYFLALFRACSARCLNNTSLSAGWIIRAMSTSWDLHFAIKFLLESTRRSFLIHICAMQHNFALKLLISCVETQNESQAPRHDIAQGKHKNEND